MSFSFTVMPAIISSSTMRKFFHPLNKQEQQPDPSTRSLLSSHTVLVDGKLLSGKDLRVYAKRHGLCQICGQTKTHQRGGSILHRTWEPITATMEGRNYIVYKGYCLQPTCYTLNKAQERLGERQRKPPRPKRRRKTRKPTAVTGTTATTAMPSYDMNIRSTTRNRNGTTRTTSSSSSQRSNSDQYNTSNSTGMSSSMSSLPRYLSPLLTPLPHEDERSHRAAAATRSYCDIMVAPNLPSTDECNNNDEVNMLYPDYYTITAVRPMPAARLDPLQQLEAATTIEQILHVLEQDEQNEQVLLAGFEALQARFLHSPVSPNDDDKDDDNEDTTSSARWATVVWKILSNSLSAKQPPSTTNKNNVILRQGLLAMLEICHQSHEHAEQAAVQGISVLVTLMRQTTTTGNGHNSDTEIRDASAVLLEKLLTYYTSTTTTVAASDTTTALPATSTHSPEVDDIGDELLPELVELLLAQLDQPDSSFDVTDSEAVRLQEYRARSLFHLTECCHRRYRSVIATALMDGKRLPGCRTVLLGLLLQDDILTDLGLQATLSLLAMIFSSSSSSSSLPESSKALGPEGLGAINSILARDDSFDTHKAAIHLLHHVISCDSNILFGQKDDDDETHADVVQSICEFLGHHYLQKDHDKLIQHGLTVLSNVLSSFGPPQIASNEQRRTLVCTIVECVQVAPESLRIASAGVFLLRILLEWDEELAQILSEVGGTDLFVKIFQLVACQDITLDEENETDAIDEVGFNDTNLEDIKQNTSLALAQLVESGHAAHDYITILRDVQVAAQKEEHRDILKALFRIIQLIIPRISTSLALYQDTRVVVSDAIPLVGSVIERILRDCVGSCAPSVGTLELVATLYKDLDYTGSLDQYWRFLPHDELSLVVSHTQSELDAIVKVMESSEEADSTLDACYTALTAFFGTASKIQTPLKAPVHTDISRVLLHALDVFKTHRSKRKVQTSASQLFWTVLRRYDGEVIIEWTARLFECIQDADCDDRNTERPFVVACDLLGLIASMSCTSRTLDNLDVLKLLLTRLKAQSHQVVFAASQALATVMQNESESSSLFVDLDGVTIALVTCLEDHQTSVQIQKSLFSLLLSQPILQHVGFRDNLANLGGFKAIVTAMTANCADSSLVLPAYRCLLTMLTDVAVEVVWGLRGHVCETLVETFRSHREDTEIQTAITDVIRNLCVKDGRYRQMLAGSIIPCLLPTMKTHMACSVLLANGCTIIRMVARYDVQHLLIQHDAVDTIVNIMLSHAASPDLLKEGLATLTKLCGDPAIRGKIDCDKAETTIVCLIEAHACDPEILKEAFGALNNLVVLRMLDRPVVSCMSDKALGVLLNAVKCFLTEEALQLNASLLLKSYTYEPYHLHLLQNASDVLVPLLFDVSENYAGEIRERAQYIIHSL